MRKRALIAVILLLALAVGWWLFQNNPSLIGGGPHQPGDPLDSLNGVVVYDNGGMSATHGRRVVDGYNVGLKFQCVEFVKRYYLEHYHHRMPDSYGDAKDFFDGALEDGAISKRRGLLQFTNPSSSRPAVGDLIILDGSMSNSYGHVAIISEVDNGEVEVIQQNCGSTRDAYDLDLIDGRWHVDNKRVLGWLRMPQD